MLTPLKWLFEDV